jgi:hypothetical protein
VSARACGSIVDATVQPSVRAGLLGRSTVQATRRATIRAGARRIAARIVTTACVPPARRLAEALRAALQAARASPAGATRRVVVVRMKAGGKEQDDRARGPAHHLFIYTPRPPAEVVPRCAARLPRPGSAFASDEKVLCARIRAGR